MYVADWVPSWLAQILTWIGFNQTLLTGLMAGAAAWFTVNQIRKQMAQTTSQIAAEKDRHEDRILRQLRAVRAGLPIALSEIYDYASQCIDALCHFIGPDGVINGDLEFDIELEKQTVSSSAAMPTWPGEAFRALQIAVEHADVEDAAALYEIIAFGQVQRSRFRSVYRRLVFKTDPSRVVLPENLMADIRDAVGLLLHAERAFLYARQQRDHIAELANADRASDTLLWMDKGGQTVREYVRSNWPPTFAVNVKTYL